MTSLQQRWNRFFFASAPLGDLAVSRILWAGTQLVFLFRGDLADRIARCAEPSAPGYEPIPMLRLLALPFGGAGALDRPQLELVYWTTILAGGLCFLGLLTRWSLLVFALGNLLLQAWVYSNGLLSHYIALLQWALFLLAFSPCGAVWSADAWLARRRAGASAPHPFEPRPGAVWPLRLVHVLVGLAYLSAAAGKVLRGPGEWFGGWTLQYYVSFRLIKGDSVLGDWLSERHGWNIAFSWLVIAFQGGFLLSLFHRKAAWLWTVAAFFVHAGATVFMGIVFPVFPVLCAALVPWCDAIRWLQGCVARAGGSLRVRSSA